MRTRQIKKATQIEPKLLLIYSFQKTGKTALASKLTEQTDAVILDFDGGASYFDNNRIVIEGKTNVEKYNDFLRKMKELQQDVEENGKYKFIIIDTLTSVYDTVANPMAIAKYNKSSKTDPVELSEVPEDVLPYGAGYSYKKTVVVNFINACLNFADNIIIFAHIGDKSVNKETGELELADLDLPGKAKTIIAKDVDSIGLMYRKNPTTNVISFKHANSVFAGSRSTYLRGKEIIISKLKEDGELETFWEEIYPITLNKE